MTDEGRASVGVGSFAARSHDAEAEVRGAWESLGERAGTSLEKALELEREISVLVARAL